MNCEIKNRVSGLGMKLESGLNDIAAIHRHDLLFSSQLYTRQSTLTFISKFTYRLGLSDLAAFTSTPLCKLIATTSVGGELTAYERTLLT